jgi:hypothetical protein
VPDIGHSVIQSSGCARRALTHFAHDEPFSQCHRDAQHNPKPAHHVVSLQKQFEVLLEDLPIDK